MAVSFDDLNKKYKNNTNTEGQAKTQNSNTAAKTETVKETKTEKTGTAFDKLNEKYNVPSETVDFEQSRLSTYNIKEARDKKYALEQEIAVLRRGNGTVNIVSSALSHSGNTVDHNAINRIKELQQEADALGRDIALASRIQTNKYLTDFAVNSQDFDKYSVEPVIPEEEKTYNIHKQANQKREDSAVKYMSEDQRAIYNYYYNRVGEAKAEEYLDSIRDDLSQKQEEAIFEGNEDNILYEYIMGAQVGLEQAKSGFQGNIRMLLGDDEYQPLTTYDYLDARIKEDLADKGFKLPEWMGGQSIGQVGYDYIKTYANMAPSIAFGAATGTGALAFGASAAGNAYNEKIREGYSKDQAAVYSSIIGTSEAMLQKVLGSVGFGGKTVASKAFEKFLPKVDSAAARVALNYGQKALSEGIEESLQEYLEPIYRNIAFGETNEAEITPEVIYAGFLGALMGAGEGNSYLVSEVKAGRENSRINDKYGESIGQIVSEGLSMLKDSEAYKLAREAKNKLNAGEELSDEELDGIVEATKAGAETGQVKPISKENPVIIQERKAPAKAEPVVEKAEETPAATDVESLAREAVSEPSARATSRRFDSVLSQIDKRELSKDSIEKLVKDFPNANKNTPKQISEMYDSGDGLSAESFFKGIEEAYKYGSMSYPIKDMETDAVFAKELPSEKRLKAYYMGENNAKNANIAKAKETQSRVLPGVKGKVIFESGAATQVRNNLQKATINIIDKVLKDATNIEYHVFASYVYKGEAFSYKAADGKTVEIRPGMRVYNNGGKIVKAPNGYYIPGKHQIWVDINAGSKGLGTMLYTITHEHLHDIKIWSPEHYNKLVNIVSQAYERGGKSFAEAVDSKFASYKNSHSETTYEDAQEEVIAEAMSGLLRDENGLRELSIEIQKQDKTLWEKIKNWFADVIARITNAYKEVEPESEEAKILMQQKELFEHAQKVFAEAVVTAGENYKNSGAQSSISQVKNAETNAKFQARNADGSQQNQEKDSEGNILSAEQVEFFKNSKVRDENGALKVMHHGTDSAGFTVFDPLYSDDAISLFFTDNTDVAGSYSGKEVDSRYDPYHENTNIKTAEDFDRLYQEPFTERKSDETISKIRVEKVGPELEKSFVNKMEADSMQLIRFAEKFKDQAAKFFSMPFDNYENADLIKSSFEDLNKIPDMNSVDGSNIEEFANTFSDVMDGIATLSIISQHYFNYVVLPENPSNMAELRKQVTGLEEREKMAWQMWGGFQAREDLLKMFETNKDKWVWFTEASNRGMRNGTKAIGIDPDDDATMFGTEEEVVKRAVKFGADTGMINVGGNRYDVYLNLENPYIYEGEEKFKGTLWSFEIVEDIYDEYDVYVMFDRNAKKKHVDHFFDQYEVEQFIKQSVTDKDVKAKLLREITGDFANVPVDLVINDYWNNLKGPDGSKWNTRKYTQYAKDNGYDGIIFKGIYDNGGQSHYEEADVPSTIAVAFSSEQVKDVDNKTPTKDPDIRYQIRGEAKKEIRKAIKDKNFGGEIKLTENSPKILIGQKGVRDLPLMMKASHIRENILSEKEAKKLGLKVNALSHYHALGEKLFINVIDDLENVTEAYRGTKNAENSERRENYFILISTHKDAQGNEINIPVYINEKGSYHRVFMDINKVATVFGRSDFRKYIQNEIKNGNLIRIKNRSNSNSESPEQWSVDYTGTTSKANIAQQSENVKHSLRGTKFQDRDSDGRELSKEQVEFFKDSKVRDEDGNLAVVYHGTRKADFTRFNRNFNFFTDSREMAESYAPNGELFTGYLDIKNPFIIDAKGERWSKVPIDEETKKFLDKYGASTFKEKGQWRTTPADIAYAIQDGIDEGEFDYDGIIIKNIDDTGGYYKSRNNIVANDYIAFSSNQFKNLDNKTPTTDPDIRYSDRNSDVDIDTQINMTRAWIDNIEDRLSDPFFAEENPKVANELRAKLESLYRDLRGELAEVRKQTKKTSLKTILENLEYYSDLDIEGLANDISENNWDFKEEGLSRAEIIEGIREMLEEKMEDMSPLEQQSPKFGFYVRPVNKNDDIRYSDRDYFYQEREEDLSVEDRNRMEILENKNKRLQKELADLEKAYSKAQDYARAEGVLAGQIEQGKKMAKEIDKKKEQIAEIKAKRDELLAKAKAEKAKAVEKVRKEARERLDRKIRDAKAQEIARLTLAKTTSEAQKKAIIEKYRTSIKNATEKRHGTDVRHKIRRVVNELNTLLVNQTKERHVPLELQKPVAAALDMLNLDDQRYYESRIRGLESKIAQAQSSSERHILEEQLHKITDQRESFKDKIDGLKKAYKAIEVSADPHVSIAYNANIASMIDKVSEEIGDTLLRDMNNAQLNMVYDLYKGVLKTVRDANKLFAKEKAEGVIETGDKVIEEIKKNHKVIEEIGAKKLSRKKFWWNNLKPVYAFEKIGSPTLTKLFKNIRKGEDVWITDVTEAKNFFRTTANKYHFDSWKMDKTFEFKSNTGRSFNLNLPQMMSLYAYVKRDQSIKHLTDGGFVFDNNKTIQRKGKEYVVNTAQAYNISTETLGQIISKLSKEQMNFVDDMQNYLSEVMGAKGNEVSRAMYDIELFRESNYFPLKSAKQFMVDKNEVINATKQLVNSGFTKPIQPGANNPIILSDFMDVWANHVNDMSMYHSFVMPIEDFNKVYNFQFGRGEDYNSTSVKQTVQDAFTKAANDYIEDLIKDINGGARVDPREGTYKQLLGNWKKAAVFASASVVIQQPSAIGRALAEVNLKYFLTPTKVSQFNHKKAWEQLKKYAPVAAIKEMGYFDADMGMSTVDFIQEKEYKGIFQKAKGFFTDKDYRDSAISFAPAMADEFTWCAIWDAVKRETKAKHKNLNVNSEEFLKIAGERFSDVVAKTQVYDSVLSRSANMRSHNIFMQMLTAFMAEPTTSANMAYDAMLELKAGNKKKAVAYISSVGTSVVLNSLLVSLVYAMRDDDEDERYHEKYLQSLTKELIDGINPLTYIPFIKDIWSIFQGWDVERVDMSLIADLYDNLDKTAKKTKELTEGIIDGSLSDEEIEAGFKELLKESALPVLDTIASMGGVPLKNVRRDIGGVINTFKTFANQKNLPYSDKFLWETIADNALDQLPFGHHFMEEKDQRLLEGMRDGNDDYMERLKKTYTSEESYLNAVRGTLKAYFLDGELRESQVKTYLMVYGDKDLDEADSYLKSWKFEKKWGFAWSNRADAYYSGEVGAKTLERAIMDYTGGTEAEAVAARKTLDFKRKNSDTSLSDDQIKNYYTPIKIKNTETFLDSPYDAGISERTYTTYMEGKLECKGVDKDGDGRADSGSVKKEVMAVIDSLDLTKEQKDILYFDNGWAKSTLWEAPWR